MGLLGCRMLDKNKVNHLIDTGYISKRKHPTENLYILNYTPKCQIEWHWTPETIACRGLIVDDNWNIIERPFLKFFTQDQWETLRNDVAHLYGVQYKYMMEGPFSVYDKLDGSFSVLFFTDGKPQMATRGSFESEQAIRANQMIQGSLAKQFKFPFDRSATYLFEIIYPENRVVVNYGAEEKMPLLAVIDKQTGKDRWDLFERYKLAGFPAASLYNFQDYVPLGWHNKDYGFNNKEGFVIYFHNSGMRVKVKFKEYMRLHKIMTGSWTDRKIWWMLREGYDLKSYMEEHNIPDEFYHDIIERSVDMKIKYDEIYKHVQSIIQKEIIRRNPPLTRKQLAIKYKDYQYKAVMFAILDNKEYKQTIWRLIRP